ncbi:hypothetical protein B0H67DRAFT_587763 [Lasiosphaeris hirsuta]|uniref:Uncharacterized protein n=1 Tax=Lasiosphaeris hirsuta TaxID=260670 RepID=A0AA40A1I4_9PEZI|nr:hypothetical protein B0H67DRAFT_587763 [Lasiosphaeris hirsuta]
MVGSTLTSPFLVSLFLLALFKIIYQSDFYSKLLGFLFDIRMSCSHHPSCHHHAPSRTTSKMERPGFDKIRQAFICYIVCGRKYVDNGKK